MVKDCISENEPDVLIFPSFRISSLIGGFAAQNVIDFAKYFKPVPPMEPCSSPKSPKVVQF